MKDTTRQQTTKQTTIIITRHIFINKRISHRMKLVSFEEVVLIIIKG